MGRIKFSAFLLLTLVFTGSFVETSHAQHKKRRTVVRQDIRVRHKVVVRKAHVRYAHLPRWGAAVTTAPVGAVVIKTHPNPYYFHNGIYYTPRQERYVVVRPARGVRIKALPTGYRRIIVGPRHYYYYYGTFYTKRKASGEYETVDAPVGAVIDALPDGYDVKTINGEEYYVLDGVTYAEVDAAEFDDGTGYEVVALQ